VPTAPIISVLNLLSGIVALLVSYYAYKNNKLVGSILLRYISVGFLLLGVSLFLQAATESAVSATAIEAIKVRDAEILAFLLYTALQLVAYAVFAWGYGLSLFSHRTMMSAPVPVVLATSSLAKRIIEGMVFVLAIYEASQLAIIVLLLLIVYQGILNFQHTKSSLSLMVLSGFSLIFLAHLLMLGAVLTLGSTAFLIGNTIEFCGFLSLLFFLYWSGRVVK